MKTYECPPSSRSARNRTSYGIPCASPMRGFHPHVANPDPCCPVPFRSGAFPQVALRRVASFRPRCRKYRNMWVKTARKRNGTGRLDGGYAPNRGVRTNVSRETLRWRDGGNAPAGGGESQTSLLNCHRLMPPFRLSPRAEAMQPAAPYHPECGGEAAGVEAFRAVPTDTLPAGVARDPTNSLALAIGWQRAGSAGRRWPFPIELLSTWTQNGTHDNFRRCFGSFASGFQKGDRHIPRSRNARDDCDLSSPRVTLSGLSICAHFSTLVGIPRSHERATRC